MDAIRVDLDWLRDYAAALDGRADEARNVLSGLKEDQLTDDAFGEVGQSLRTPQAYQRAAESLFAQLDRADEALTAAATALRQAAEHYQGTDFDGARTLEKKSGDDGAAR
ncbi:MAG: type VII secretion target [Pseudonocardiaceae bacterium]